MRKKGCCFANNRKEIAVLLAQARSKGRSSADQWQKAEVFSSLLKCGISASMIARETGHSVTMVLGYANAFDTFQNSRVDRNLSFTHYRYAAKTSDPEKWIKIAAEKNLTSRQLEQKIKKAQERKTTGKWTAAQARKNAEQYAIILDALAQQLGIDWDGEPTAWFAQELVGRVAQLVKKCEAAAKVNAAVFKKLSKAAV
jgi:hypothetical protein